MKNEYNVLWIDDKPDTVEDDIPTVKEFLLDFGIHTNVISVQPLPGNNILDTISTYLKAPELDLLLIDFDMGEDDEGVKVFGSDLISQIRKTEHVFLPIIFYSAHGVGTLLDKAREQELEGVFFANRNNLIDKFERVVENLLIKEKTVKRSRGLLMDEMSELDGGIIEILVKGFSNLDAERQAQFLKYMNSKQIKKSKDYEAFLNQSTESVNDFLSSMHCDLSLKWKLLKKLLELHPKKDQVAQQLGVFLELYQPPEGVDETICQIRNKYAHQRRNKLESGHTEENRKFIRTETRKQNINLLEIKDGLLP